MLMLNVLLALAWAAVTGKMSAGNLVVGFAVGYIVLWMFSRIAGGSGYFANVVHIIRFALYFLWELLVATLRVAVDIEGRSPAEVTLLANAITLTPGTLSLDVSPDAKSLYVHVMYASDVEESRREIQEGFGRRVQEMFR